MRPFLRPVLAFTIAAVILSIGATGAFSAPDAPSANSETFQDSTGENPAAPDITTITVSNTDAGILSFKIAIPNRPTLGQDMIILVWVDSDNNVETGSPDYGGADYVMELVRGEMSLYRWDGTDYTRRLGDPSAVTLNFTYQAGAITIRISAAELGNTKAFKFLVFVASGCELDPVNQELDCSNAVADAAPGGGAGLYPFQVEITPPTLVVRRVTAGKPTAGKTFTIRMVAARSDTGATIKSGRVTCVGRVGRVRLNPRVQRVVAGAATCTWNLPVRSKGKTFRGSVAVQFEGLRVAESYTSRIR